MLAVIDSAETSLLRPRLKFMLGELLLGGWQDTTALTGSWADGCPGC